MSLGKREQLSLLSFVSKRSPGSTRDQPLDSGLISANGDDAGSHDSREGLKTMGQSEVVRDENVEVEHKDKVNQGDAGMDAYDIVNAVWSWGDCSCDALGYDTDGYQLIPWKIPDMPNITKIAVGNHHTLALSVDGELYFWGKQASEESASTPKKIKVQNVVHIEAVRGCSISAFKTTEGIVYYWGFAFVHYIPKPVATKYSTIVKLFASLDTPVMLGALKLNVNQPMTEKLKLIFDDSDTSDIKFVVEEKVIHAHKLLLKLRSDHFERMFNSNWKESKQEEVKVTEFTYKSFRTFLMYLYTYRIEPTAQVAEDVIDLFKLADYYGEEDLKRRCEQQLKLMITEDNFSQVYSASIQYNSKVLHEVALDLAIPNLNNVVQTDGYKSMSDELQKRLIQELAEEGVLVGLERKRAKYSV